MIPKHARDFRDKPFICKGSTLLVCRNCRAKSHRRFRPIVLLTH